MSAKLRGIFVDGRVQRTRGKIENWSPMTNWFENEAEQQRVAKHVAARMRRPADNSLGQNFEALERQLRLGVVPDCNSDLGLHIQHVDVRNVAWDGVFQAICDLETIHQSVGRKC